MLENLARRLTISEASKYLDVPPVYLYRAIKANRISVFISNNTRYITLEEMERIVKEKIFVKKIKNNL